MVKIDYKNKGASCQIELPKMFQIPHYGAIMEIKIAYSGKEGVAFTSRIMGSDIKPKRHFVTCETFVFSYGKYKIS